MGDLTRLTKAVIQGDLRQVRTILDENRELVHQRDETGATALHYATLGGHREIVQLLLDNGAEINKADGQFGATPTGWAIEYLRERGGFLAIELDDLAYAIEHGDAKWVARFLKRFPTLRQCIDTKGKPFRQLAQESGNPEIMGSFSEYLIKS
jgi:ankyrin repeat protein